jgi:ribokinase
VGSANVDLVVRCDHLPQPGETIMAGHMVRLPGGKGANQAVALAHLGEEVAFIARLGDDESGDWLAGILRARGVDLSGLQRDSNEATGTAFITVDASGENHIVVVQAANDYLDSRNTHVEQFDVVLAQMEVPTSVIDDVALRAKALVLNVAPIRPIDPATLARCAVVIANEIEVESLELSALEHCVVTLGAEGAVSYRFGREMARVSPPPVHVVDTVGAGDAFCAAYASRFARGYNETDALRFAVTAASLATRAVGAQTGLPHEQEVEQWLVDA